MKNLFPENISTYGGEIDQLFWITLAFVTIAFLISLFLLNYPLFRFRHQQNRKAAYIKGNNWKQLKWVIIACAVLLICDIYILFAEHPTWHKMEEYVPEADVHIGITGRQWNYVFTYPGPDGKLYTVDDVVINQQNSEMHVPVNKNIVIDLRAVDVVHSFFVSNLRLKQDAIPGRTIQRWFNATKEGTYDIACAEICGVLHSKMRNFLVVESQEEYDAFLEELYTRD